MIKLRFETNNGMLYYSTDAGKCWSGMGIDLELLMDFLNDNYIDFDDKELVTVGTQMSVEDFGKIQTFWFDWKYIEYRGLHFDRASFSSKKDIAKTIIQAMKSRTPLCDIYESSYCSYPSEEDEGNAMYSQDGLTHIYHIGQTTGDKKFPIALTSKYALGGDILSLYGIKEAILLKGI